MINSNLPGMDEIKMLGMPYHGLWKAGSITLPNATTKTCPTPGNGGVVMLKVPGQPAVSRSPAELAADTADGKEWRNYGLLSGGRFGGSAPLYAGLGTAVVVLIDDSNACWLMHITWAAAETFMRVKLRRFMRIESPWAEQAWSSTINVTTDPYFRYALAGSGYNLLTVAQNTTGREFVLGSVALGSVDEYSLGLIKINVSGTVDLSVSGFGLTFSGTLIGGAAFEACSEVITDVVTGDFTISSVTTWHERDTSTGTLTGNTTTTTKISTNGVLVRDDLPAPPTNTPPLTWDQGDIANTSTSARTQHYTRVFSGSFALWAGYHNDVLKLLTADVVFVDKDLTAVTTYVDHIIPPGGYGLTNQFRVNGSETTSCEITYTYGATVVGHRTTSHLVTSSPIDGPVLIGIGSTTSTTPRGQSIDQAAGWMSYVYQQNLDPVADVPYAFPLTVSGIPWSTPCIASVNRLGAVAPFTWQTIKVTAPSGASAATSVAMATLGASWNPASDQLAVDSVPVCWF